MDRVITDWTKPFPKDAIAITKPDSHDIVWRRAEQAFGTPIPRKVYVVLEAERQMWVEQQNILKERERQAAEAEFKVQSERRMVRDSLEDTANRVLEKLSHWVKYVDTDRWVQLEIWLDTHPQRWKEQDELFSLLDDIDWEDPFAQLRRKEEEARPKRGRPKGIPVSEETRAKMRTASQKRWANDPDS